jgi:hypothetical protein
VGSGCIQPDRQFIQIAGHSLLQAHGQDQPNAASHNSL